MSPGEQEVREGWPYSSSFDSEEAGGGGVGTGLEMGNLEDPAHLKRDRRCPQGAREQARCVWPWSWPQGGFGPFRRILDKCGALGGRGWTFLAVFAETESTCLLRSAWRASVQWNTPTIITTLFLPSVQGRKLGSLGWTQRTSAFAEGACL